MRRGDPGPAPVPEGATRFLVSIDRGVQANERMRRKSERKEADAGRLEEAIEFYLRSCYGSLSPARTQELAQHLKLSRPYLSRRAAELTGKTLIRLLRERQLARAKRLLLIAHLSIEQVARACAFGTEQTFIRCFRAAFGVTPSAYRKQVTKRE